MRSHFAIAFALAFPLACTTEPPAHGGADTVDASVGGGGVDGGGDGWGVDGGNDAGGTAPDKDGPLSPAGPCPAAPAPCRILPMGDSITFGIRATPSGSVSSGGYRRYLRRALLDDRKSFAYVGTCPGFGGRCRILPDGNPLYCQSGGAPELGRHDGHPGWDINAFRARDGGSCPGDIDTFLSRVTDSQGEHVTPDIVLLLVGANDVRAGAGIREGAARRFRYLLDDLLAALPDRTLIAVGSVTPNLNGTNNRDGVIPFNEAITDVVRARRDAGHNVMMVDTYGAIRINGSGNSPDLSSDRLHPNEQGYQRIAERWLDAIGSLVH